MAKIYTDLDVKRGILAGLSIGQSPNYTSDQNDVIVKDVFKIIDNNGKMVDEIIEMSYFDKIGNRELAIYADIFFNDETYRKLQSVMSEISINGHISSLSRKDKYFSYCRERNAWYGSETPTHLPYVSVEILNDLT